MATTPRPGSMRERAAQARVEFSKGREHREPQESQWQRQRPSHREPPHEQRAPGPPPDTPDSKYRHLALYFRDQAAKDRIQLRLGPVLIEREIRQAFAALDVEGGSRKFEDDLTYAQVYRDGTGKELPWYEVAERVIDEFWTYVWDKHAVSYFCDHERLDALFWAVCRRWQNARAKPARRAAPEPMTWNTEQRNRRTKRGRV